jgi:hypothetical protein
MKVIEYSNIEVLINAAKMHQKEIFETDASLSFRVFQNKKCIELHIYRK